MKDCNISFQNKPALVISRIYKSNNRFHLPKINQFQSQSPNNIYYNEYFTEVRGIKALPDKQKQNSERILKCRLKEMEVQNKQQKSLSAKHLYNEQIEKKEINNLLLEPYFVQNNLKAKKYIMGAFQPEIYKQTFGFSPNSKTNQKQEKETRKPRFFFQETQSEKVKHSKLTQTENDNSIIDQEYNYWKNDDLDQREDEDLINNYVNGLL
ncbi:unnamed protein product [Paramecium primaurelia]|uniref:Uncharacterized protein n=2 Tax=Paramecium TaxID=5884 RepID=A0A8S1SBD6_9CILI|nr:unnamed protein product [Paramecium primaurelia]CAD8136194.1 unnamed protein product [Paramecium pentaurelia]